MSFSAWRHIISVYRDIESIHSNTAHDQSPEAVCIPTHKIYMQNDVSWRWEDAILFPLYKKS